MNSFAFLPSFWLWLPSFWLSRALPNISPEVLLSSRQAIEQLAVPSGALSGVASAGAGPQGLEQKVSLGLQAATQYSPLCSELGCSTTRE